MLLKSHSSPIDFTVDTEPHFGFIWFQDYMKGLLEVGFKWKTNSTS
jgi:hypothetical protein